MAAANRGVFQSETCTVTRSAVTRNRSRKRAASLVAQSPPLSLTLMTRAWPTNGIYRYMYA